MTCQISVDRFFIFFVAAVVDLNNWQLLIKVEFLVKFQHNMRLETLHLLNVSISFSIT